MRLLCCVFVAFSLVGCIGSWTVPEFEDTSRPRNVTIAELRDYMSGAEVVIANDVVIAGRVVSSTRAGNFYNTFLIDDGTGAVEIMAGWPDLDAVYHPGQQVVVSVRGLAVGWRDGVMQLGLPPDPGSRYPTGYFYHPVVAAEWVMAERSVIPVSPIVTDIALLDSDLCGRLVRIDGLRADGALATGATWATRWPEPTTGYVKFRSSERGPDDFTGRPQTDSITIVTSGYASFAGATVPRGEGSLTGILLWGRGGGGREHFLLKLRDEEDIDF